ncbi:hypothetical protein [Streptomyces sp. NRRL WC-3742]|uniref:hypothetical protein n=1 Tax=Streptomyces sp. NRRL WC-3742 TaxID=1463934 RepID=UPI00131BFF37|nr:hypothetical protein [Streptomyces sp. NRRL WC-3742]
MARKGGDLEAFVAFLGGVLAAGVTAMAMVGLGLTHGPTPEVKAAAVVTLGAVWLTVTTTVYLRLRRQPSKSRAADSS